jgi:hypothetical protein
VKKLENRSRNGGKNGNQNPYAIEKLKDFFYGGKKITNRFAFQLPGQK